MPQSGGMEIIMKKVLTIFLLMMLCVSAFSGCNNVSSENSGSEHLTTDQNSSNPPSNHQIAGTNIRIWDYDHPDDSERNPYSSFTLVALNNATVKYTNNNEIYVDGEYLLGGSGYSCVSFYLCDLTGDGVPELCLGSAWGSGIVNRGIEVIDYTTKETIFTLSDRTFHDYYLFLRNGVLCVKETEYGKHAAVRTGVLAYNGSEISVVWDSVVNATVDRDPTPAPGEPIS